MAQGINRSRKDDNQDAIVEALEAAGCKVQSLAGVGRGCPDLLVATGNLVTAGDIGHPWVIIEVKDGAKSPSERKLTPKELVWHKKFNYFAPVWVVYDEIGALWVCGKTSEVPKIKPIRMVE
jgi:hypothetical protein